MMEVYSVAESYDGMPYKPVQLIENRTSFIWTERFNGIGDFELRSKSVFGTMVALPIGSFITHQDTRELMIVETHEVEMVGEGADARPEIIVRGRSCYSILEDRWIEAPYQKKRRMRQKYSAAAAVCVLMYNVVANSSGADVTRGDNDPETQGVVNDYPWNLKDKIPNVIISEAAWDEGNTRWWRLEEGPAWPQIQKILVDQDLGVRSVRPAFPNYASVVTVRTSLSVRGEVVRTDRYDIDQLRFEVYSGVDRTRTVKMSVAQDHLDNVKYLMSQVGYKNSIEVMTGEVRISDIIRTGEGNKTGWQRRVGGFDAGTPDIPPEPKKPDELRANATAAQKKARREAMDKWIDQYAKWKNKRDRIVADFNEEAAKAGRAYLKATKKVDLFAGQISKNSPYRYGFDYFLGDKITLYGDYDKKVNMIVSEYVRAETESGEVGMPGLVLPD